MKGKHVRHRLADLKRKSIRDFDGEKDELIALADSWLANPIHDIICRADLTVADGNRRVAGLMLRGIEEVEVFVASENFADDQLDEIAMVSAYHRKGLTPYEQWKAITSIRIAHPEWNNKQIADHLHIDPAKVTRLFSLDTCIESVKDAARAGNVGEMDWYAISRSPVQEETLRLKLSGAPAAKVKASTKKYGSPTVRTAKIKCPLPSGQVITVSGDELSLDEAIDSLKEAVKAMTKARDQGLDAKTAQAVWSDMAAAAT